MLHLKGSPFPSRIKLSNTENVAPHQQVQGHELIYPVLKPKGGLFSPVKLSAPTAPPPTLFTSPFKSSGQPPAKTPSALTLLKTGLTPAKSKMYTSLTTAPSATSVMLKERSEDCHPLMSPPNTKNVYASVNEQLVKSILSVCKAKANETRAHENFVHTVSTVPTPLAQATTSGLTMSSVSITAIHGKTVGSTRCKNLLEDSPIEEIEGPVHTDERKSTATDFAARKTAPAQVVVGCTPLAAKLKALNDINLDNSYISTCKEKNNIAPISLCVTSPQSAPLNEFVARNLNDSLCNAEGDSSLSHLSVNSSDSGTFEEDSSIAFNVESSKRDQSTFILKSDLDNSSNEDSLLMDTSTDTLGRNDEVIESSPQPAPSMEATSAAAERSPLRKSLFVASTLSSKTAFGGLSAETAELLLQHKARVACTSGAVGTAGASTVKEEKSVGFDEKMYPLSPTIDNESRISTSGDGFGSVVVYDLVPASKKRQEIYGATQFLSPVRRSFRTLKHTQSGTSPHEVLSTLSNSVNTANANLSAAAAAEVNDPAVVKKMSIVGCKAEDVDREMIESMLESSDFAFLPNPFLSVRMPLTIPTQIRNEKSTSDDNGDIILKSTWRVEQGEGLRRKGAIEMKCIEEGTDDEENCTVPNKISLAAFLNEGSLPTSPEPSSRKRKSNPRGRCSENTKKTRLSIIKEVTEEFTQTIVTTRTTKDISFTSQFSSMPPPLPVPLSAMEKKHSAISSSARRVQTPKSAAHQSNATRVLTRHNRNNVMTTQEWQQQPQSRTKSPLVVHMSRSSRVGTPILAKKTTCNHPSSSPILFSPSSTSFPSASNSQRSPATSPSSGSKTAKGIGVSVSRQCTPRPARTSGTTNNYVSATI